MSSDRQIVVIWDCRVKHPRPLNVWKVINDITKGQKPTTLLILQPSETEIPGPLKTVMRMITTKMFVGDDAVQFAFLELCILLAQAPSSKILMVTDDIRTFVRPFRIATPESAVFITSQTLGWPFSHASWAKSIQFVPLPRGKA